MLNMKHMRVASPYPSHANIGVRDGGAGFSRSVRYVARRRRGKSSHLVMHEKKWNIQGYYLCPLGLMKPLTYAWRPTAVATYLGPGPQTDMKVADVLMLSYGGGPRSGKYWIRRNYAEKWNSGQSQGAGTLARRPGSGNGPVCTSLNARSGPGAFHTLEWPRPARAANSGSWCISREIEAQRQL